MSLLVFGTVALDNVRTPSGDKRGMLGGSAAHFAMAARLFTDVHLVAVVGRDFPEKYIRFLKHKGVDLSSLKTCEGQTFRWDGEYKKEDLNCALTLATQLGVLMGATPEVSGRARQMTNVFLANIDPDMQMGLLRMLKKPRFVGLDSMNLWINTKRKSLLRLMGEVDLFVANDAEAKSLSGETNLIRAAKALRAFGPRFIVIKKGEHGVFFYSDKFMFSFPAYPVEHVVDPTGAGDTFAGALMGCLCREHKITRQTLKKAVIYATTVASFNVQGFGMDKTAVLTLPMVNRRKGQLLKFMSI